MLPSSLAFPRSISDFILTCMLECICLKRSSDMYVHQMKSLGWKWVPVHKLKQLVAGYLLMRKNNSIELCRYCVLFRIGQKERKIIFVTFQSSWTRNQLKKKGVYLRNLTFPICFMDVLSKGTSQWGLQKFSKPPLPTIAVINITSPVLILEREIWLMVTE